MLFVIVFFGDLCFVGKSPKLEQCHAVFDSTDCFQRRLGSLQSTRPPCNPDSSPSRTAGVIVVEDDSQLPPQLPTHDTAPLPDTQLGGTHSARCGGSDDDEPLVLEMKVKVIDGPPAYLDEESLMIGSSTAFVYMTLAEFLVNHGVDGTGGGDDVTCLKRVWRSMMLDGSVAKRFRKE